MKNGWMSRKSYSICILSLLLVLFISSLCEAAGSDQPDFGFLSLLPPLVAIGLCIFTKEVIPSLFVGIWL
ncbi:MAG TPA: hypothetical protein PLV56_10960, partial [Synergistales bacterium]|nr:hypothetical protein [Synergistales bacterium]